MQHAIPGPGGVSADAHRASRRVVRTGVERPGRCWLRAGVVPVRCFSRPGSHPPPDPLGLHPWKTILFNRSASCGPRRAASSRAASPRPPRCARCAPSSAKRPPDGHRRDLLIEHLHALNDAFHGLFERHLVALAAEMRLPMVEVFEVASFYHHFEILKDDATAPALTVRVCNGPELRDGRRARTAGAPARVAGRRRCA